MMDVFRRFLVSRMKGKVNPNETIHHWRKGWEFVALHSFRVESYVRRIFSGERGDTGSDELRIARAAAILHDIGRNEDRANHAALGAKIVREWLAGEGAHACGIQSPERIAYLVERHSDKQDRDERDFCLCALRDADVLDEIGLMSIFMASNHLSKGDPFFFHSLLDRIEGFEIDFCEKGFGLLVTRTAKDILQEKKRFIELASDQLRDEISGTEDAREMLLNLV